MGVIAWVVSFINESNEPAFTPQANFGVELIGSCVGAWLVMGLLFPSGKSDMYDSFYDKVDAMFFNKVHTVCNGFTQGQKVTDIFCKLINKVVGAIATLLGFPGFVLFDITHHDVSEFMADCGRQLRSWEISGKPMDADVVSDVDTYRSRYLALSRKYIADPAAKQSIMQAWNLLAPIAKAIEIANVGGASPREQPVGIIICGPPGVGKSYGINDLMREVQAATASPAQLERLKKNPNALTFPRKVGAKFWDGYLVKTIYLLMNWVKLAS